MNQLTKSDASSVGSPSMRVDTMSRGSSKSKLRITWDEKENEGTIKKHETKSNVEPMFKAFAQNLPNRNGFSV